MKYDTPQRVFLVSMYYQFRCMSKVINAWNTKYKNSDPPSHSTIKNIVSNFEKTGSVAHVPPKCKMPSPKREAAKIELQKMVAEFPSLSIRKAASALSISPTLTYKIYTDDLHLSAYKFHLWHKLEDKDYEKRANFAKWFIKRPASVLDHMIFSDEAYFYLTLPVNKQNNRIWSQANPLIGVEQPLYDKKILVWCGISASRVFGPFYFSETVNQVNYLDMLKNFFWPKLLDTADYKKYYFQQDGARPHTAETVQTWLTSKFGQKFLDKESWPPRSPDLNPCDFFFVGSSKGESVQSITKNIR
jgi:hypothetical protein